MVGIKQGPSGIKQKELQIEWPVEEGLTAATQRQKGRQTQLQVQERSVVKRNEQVGFS